MFEQPDIDLVDTRSIKAAHTPPKQSFGSMCAALIDPVHCSGCLSLRPTTGAIC